jgi:selenophosphate synthetase-related protein
MTEVTALTVRFTADDAISSIDAGTLVVGRSGIWLDSPDADAWEALAAEALSAANALRVPGGAA